VCGAQVFNRSVVQGYWRAGGFSEGEFDVRTFLSVDLDFRLHTYIIIIISCIFFQIPLSHEEKYHTIYLNIRPSWAMAYTILGMGNMLPNMLTVRPAMPPAAITHLHL
jgi:hypothetical protein